jgi:hypothetical protein
MSPEDQERYGGPEWIEFDYAQVADEELSVLEEFETVTGLTITEFGAEVGRGSVKGIRAMLWLARRMAGCVDEWASFQPKILKVETESDEADDADPPDATAGNRAARRAAARKTAVSKT